MRKKISAVLLAAFFIIILFTSCAKNTAEISILAAASLENSLTEIIKEYEAETNIKITASYAASGQLKMQIENGAPCDIFISAGKKQTDALEEAGFADKSLPLLQNTLVIVSKTAGITGPDSLRGLKTIAMGEEKTVPAGQYAKEALENAELWQGLSKKAVMLSNVREVLAAVESGNADAGFVYATDAAVSAQSLYITAVPQKLYGQILYPAMLTRGGTDSDAAQKFYDYLFTEKALSVFESYGFTAA